MPNHSQTTAVAVTAVAVTAVAVTAAVVKRREIERAIWTYAGRKVEPFVPARHSISLTGLNVHATGTEGPVFNVEPDGSVHIPNTGRINLHG